MRIKDEKKYDAIISASMNQFKEEGFAKASISKIAKAAGVSPATIYIHFENKEDLILKLYLHLRKEMSEYILKDVDLEGCIETEYKKLWFNYYRYCLTKKESFNYIMQFTNSPYMETYKSYGMCYYGKIYELFKIGKEKGIIKKVSDEILFAFTFNPASQLAKRHDCCGTKLCGAGVVNACSVAWDAISEKGVGIECKKMKMNLKERLIDIFKSGETEIELIGVEFEHFLIDEKTLRSYNYEEKNGQHSIVKRMVEDGWTIDYEEEGCIFSIEKKGTFISFEPGGQFEISVEASATINEIEEKYLAVKGEVESYLVEGQALVSLGYHPLTKIDELPLLPKARYGLMYDYLHNYGYMARNMMKGTASTQVIIDYKDEDDFIKKYRVSNFLSPFIARLFDASPVFEGELYDEENLRMKVWENTDISRSKYPDDVMNMSFGYDAYAEYISNIRPVFLPKDDGVIQTENKTLGQLSTEGHLTDQQIEHGLSMAFPDVRLKKYIELRMPDALPYPLNLAVPTLVKGLFYNQKLLDEYYQLSLAFNDTDLVKMNDQLKKDYHLEFKCKNEKITCNEFIASLLNNVLEGLEPSEKKYLQQFIDFYNKHDSVSSYLKSVYNTDSFITFLKGDVHV
jgi:glutamate--cysteine ligase